MLYSITEAFILKSWTNIFPFKIIVQHLHCSIYETWGTCVKQRYKMVKFYSNCKKLQFDYQMIMAITLIFSINGLRRSILLVMSWHHCSFCLELAPLREDERPFEWLFLSSPTLAILPPSSLLFLYVCREQPFIA